MDQHGGPFGFAVLQETDGALAESLWLGLRRVWTWADASPRIRERLGRDESPPVIARRNDAEMEAPDLAPALRVFSALRQSPATVSEVHVAEACRLVAEWADRARLREIAIHFIEAAARANPADPGLANWAGSTCRRAALHDRAAVWYARGFRLAVKARSQREAIWAQLGYGALMKELGRPSEARVWFRQAAKRALRTGRKREAAEAFHDLLAIAAEAGKLRHASRYAVLASRYYPLWHPRLPYLAHDFAFLLMRCHQYALAYPLLESFVAVAPVRYQHIGLGTLARVAAGRGLVDRYESLELRVLELIEATDEYAPAAYMHLAEGARMLGRWEKADRYAAHALAVGTGRQDHIIIRDARVLLDRITARVPAEITTAPVTSGTRILVNQFALRLRRWKSSSGRAPDGEMQYPAAAYQKPA